MIFLPITHYQLGNTETKTLSQRRRLEQLFELKPSYLDRLTESESPSRVAIKYTKRSCCLSRLLNYWYYAIKE